LKRRIRRRRSAGFTLLEVIVSLALIGSTGLALTAWINTNLNAAALIRDRAARSQLRIAAAEVVQSVNPMDRPLGSIEVGTLHVEWRAEPQAPATLSASFNAAGSGQYRVQLYKTDVRARDVALGAETSFDVILLGFRYSGTARGGEF
jgi:prepilin-type N-terminal cleavage/methylation domain-containing protein